MEAFHYIVQTDTVGISRIFLMGNTVLHHLRNSFFRHANTVVFDTNTDFFLFPVNRKHDPPFPVNITDSVIDTIFHDRLQEHARNMPTQKGFIYFFLKMDLPRKPDV